MVSTIGFTRPVPQGKAAATISKISKTNGKNASHTHEITISLISNSYDFCGGFSLPYATIGEIYLSAGRVSRGLLGGVE